MKRNKIRKAHSIFAGPSDTYLDTFSLPLYLLLFVLLAIVYKRYIANIFGYEGFDDYFNKYKCLISIMLLSFLTLVIRSKGPCSHFLLNVIFQTSVIPSLVLFSGADLPISFAVIVVGAFVIIVVTVNFVTIKRLRVPQVDGRLLLKSMAAISMIAVFIALVMGGYKYLNFDFSKVYEFRRDAAGALPMIYGYIFPTLSKAIVPVGLVTSLLFGYRSMALVFLFISVLIFSIGNHKAPLFTPFVIFACYWLSGKFRAVRYFTICMVILVLLGVLDLHLDEQNASPFGGWLGNLGVRRALFVPSLLDWKYFEFFADNKKVLWAESKITLGLIESPYDLPIPLLIGFDVLKTGAHANTGYVGSGFANFGYVGVAIYAFLLGIVLVMLDTFARGLNSQYVISVSIIPILTVARSTDFPTILLTHGFLITLFILGAIRFPKSQRASNNNILNRLAGKLR